MTKKLVSHDDSVSAGSRLPPAVRTEIGVYITAAFNAFVAGAPGALDIWLELTAAIQADQSGLATLTAVVNNKQPLNSNLTTIAGLSATTNNFIVAVAGAWASRTPTQVKSTLAVTQADISDFNQITPNRQTASYSLVLTDVGKAVEMNVASANNLTVPLNSVQAIPTNSVIGIGQYGAGQTTVVATGGVTIRSRNGLKLAGQYAEASLRKIGADEWWLSGDLIT